MTDFKAHDINLAQGCLKTALGDLERFQHRHDWLVARINLLTVERKIAASNISKQEQRVEDCRERLKKVSEPELETDDITTDSWIVDVVNGGSVLAEVKRLMAFTNWWKIRHLGTDVRVYFEVGQKTEAELFIRLCRTYNWDVLPLRRLSDVRPCS